MMTNPIEVTVNPLAEIIAKKLSGISGVPGKEQMRMISRAAKASVEYHEKEIAALQATISRLEREKGLLQSFVIGGEGNCKHIFESMYVQSDAGDYFSCFLCSKCGGKLPPGEAADVLNAIDGGALGSSVNANKD